MKIVKSRNLILALFLALTSSFQWNPSGFIHTSAAQFKSASALVTPGELDPTFGEDGLVTTDMNKNSVGNAVVLQPGGKIVVAGHVAAVMDAGGGASYDFALSRYNSDGSPDTSFGANGTVSTDFAGTNDDSSAVVSQDDGKIIAAGRAWGNGLNSSCALARYDDNGSLDTAFGTDGKVRIHSTGGCTAMVLKSDGKIIVAGWVVNGGKNGFWLARLTGDGSLDTTFGDNGIVETFSDSYTLWCGSVILQSDGKIVITGQANAGLEGYFALARYNSNGSLDTLFGADGIVISPFGGDIGSSTGAIQTDGKIIVVGMSFDGSVRSFALVRFNDDGSLDTTFGINGETTTDFGGSGYAFARSIVVQPDEKIVVSGGGLSNFALARYNNDGSLDTSFGTGGKVLTDFGGDDVGIASTLQSDGKIVLVGSTDNPLNTNFALARYDSAGNLDTDFNTDGKVITKFGGSFDYGYAMALQSDGKAVMAGASSGGGDYVFSLARYNINGSLDDTFGGNGITFTKIDGRGGHAYAVAVQPDQKIVVAGGTYNGPMYYDFALARFNSDGSLDATFGSGGVVTTDFAGSTASSDGGSAIALQPDGKILVAGWSGTGGGPSCNFAMARYDSSGALDTSFGNDGKVTTDFNGLTDIANAIGLQPDHKIVVVGESQKDNTPGSYDFALARYNEDGSLDATFGANGRVTTDFGGEDLATAVTFQEDGKILVAGDSSGNSILARYNSDGSLDTTFGDGGEASSSLGSRGKVSANSGGNDFARAVVVQSDGKILLGGDSNNDFALARYNTNGSLDTTFGASGRITTDFGGSDNECYAIVLQGGWKVVAAGYTNKNSNYDFAAARYYTIAPKTMYLPLVLHQFP